MPRLSQAYKTALFFSGNRLAVYNARVLKKSPLRYFPMVSDTSILDDISANDDDGTYTGATLQSTPGPFGGLAPLFDGNNDYASMYSAALASAFDYDEGCILAWAKVSDASVWTDGQTRTIVSFFVDTNDRIDISKSNVGNRITAIREGNNTGSVFLDATTSTTDWFSALVSWSVTSNTAELFLNGVSTETGACPASTPPTLPTNSGVIGAFNTGGLLPFSGYIAHVTIWDTPADADIIALATP